jgi:hypothetical protein
MTLFECDSQFRERATMWRIFSLLPLQSGLARGRVFRWYALNIPMDLGTGGTFTSDIDIIGCFSDFPRSRTYVHETWEVKVGLLHRDGGARSLKIGKFPRTMTQLRAYRNFGSPSVGLLDVFVCEDGFFNNSEFPPRSLHAALYQRVPELAAHRFGYQVLPFEHTNAAGNDAGLRAYTARDLRTSFELTVPALGTPQDGFSRLVARLDGFFERVGDMRRKSFKQIIFCKECRQLQLIDAREEQFCPGCNANLIIQS